MKLAKSVLFGGMCFICLLFLSIVGCVEKSENNVQFAANPGAETVIFPDIDLERLVRDAINKPAGPITKSDLDAVTSLSNCVRNSCYSRVRDLTGIEYCRNLSKLHLNGSDMLDISLDLPPVIVPPPMLEMR